MTGNFNLPLGVLPQDYDDPGEVCMACDGSGEIKQVLNEPDESGIGHRTIITECPDCAGIGYVNIEHGRCA
jgi:DnaJ-class molecular chaperone